MRVCVFLSMTINCMMMLVRVVRFVCEQCQLISDHFITTNNVWHGNNAWQLRRSSWIHDHYAAAVAVVALRRKGKNRRCHGFHWCHVFTLLVMHRACLCDIVNEVFHYHHLIHIPCYNVSTFHSYELSVVWWLRWYGLIWLNSVAFVTSISIIATITTACHTITCWWLSAAKRSSTCISWCCMSLHAIAISIRVCIPRHVMSSHGIIATVGVCSYHSWHYQRQRLRQRHVHRDQLLARMD